MSRNFGAGEDFGSKTKTKNNFSNKEKFYEETITKPMHLTTVIARVKEKGVVTWRRLKDRFL